MKKFVMNCFNILIINYVNFQKFVLPISRIKKTIFNFTFAFEKRTHYELPFGQNEKVVYASPRSGFAPSCLQHQKQNGTNASRCR
jgi:hypothetical protein